MHRELIVQPPTCAGSMIRVQCSPCYAAKYIQLQQVWWYIVVGNKRSTPLGFLPGEVDTGTHCMFIYPKRDDLYLDRVARYVKAGLDSDEMCVCVTPLPSESLFRHMHAMGIDARAAADSGQLEIHDAGDIYFRLGNFDLGRVMKFWDDKGEIGRRQWNGMRAFGDVHGGIESRTTRLKLVEYESKINLIASRSSIALCGYESSTTPRTLLVQMKNVHPLVASVRSIQTNHRYLEPRRFFSTFYRFQRISRVYPGSAKYARECRRHFEEIAARTPMTVREIEDMKLALGEAFANAVEHGCDGLPDDLRHVHVCFLPQPTEFIIEVRDHGRGFVLPTDDAPPAPDQLSGRGLHLMRNLVHEVGVDRRKDDTVVTMRLAYAFPFDN